MFFVWIWRISRCPVGSGIPMSTSLSKHLKHFKERSMVYYNIWTSFKTIHMGKQLGNNMTFDFSIGLEIPVSMLSNMEKKKETTFFHALVWWSRFHWWRWWLVKISWLPWRPCGDYSLSPAILLIISGLLIKKKKAPVSFATAWAIKVFPVPGGPNMRMPHGTSLRFASSSSLLIGSPSGEE